MKKKLKIQMLTNCFIGQRLNAVLLCGWVVKSQWGDVILFVGEIFINLLVLCFLPVIL